MCRAAWTGFESVGMEIQSATVSQGQSQKAKNSALSSDFETFLRMLTVQMQNQDPLNPVESGDYAIQLATFSGVEQQVRTNALLEQIAGAGGISGISGLSEWLGKEVRAPVDVAWDGTPQSILTEVPLDADRAELVVVDQVGVEVQRDTLPLSGGEITWVGRTKADSRLPPGDYHLYVASYKGDEALDLRPAQVYRKVVEVRTENGANLVYFSNGQSVESSEVGAIRL